MITEQRSKASYEGSVFINRVVLLKRGVFNNKFDAFNDALNAR